MLRSFRKTPVQGMSIGISRSKNRCLPCSGVAILVHNDWIQFGALNHHGRCILPNHIDAKSLSVEQTCGILHLKGNGNIVVRGQRFARQSGVAPAKCWVLIQVHPIRFRQSTEDNAEQTIGITCLNGISIVVAHETESRSSTRKDRWIVLRIYGNRHDDFVGGV